jgi:hypothetical protein
MRFNQNPKFPYTCKNRDCGDNKKGGKTSGQDKRLSNLLRLNIEFVNLPAIRSK